MTGCVERADQFTASGVPSAVASTVDSQSFVLIKAEPPSKGDAGPPAVGTTGAITAGDAIAKTGAGVGNMYRLDGDRTKLNPHVGQKVEIIGVLDPASTSGRAPDPQNPSAATSPVLVVESIKTIAELCPR